MAMMEQLREQKRKLPWGYEARAAHVLAPSQSGKSHAVYHNYWHNFLLPQCRQSGEFDPDVSDLTIKKLQRKVIYCRVSSEYIGSFATAFLTATGDPTPTKGSVDDRIDRGETQMDALGSELLVLESFDNLTRAQSAQSEREADRTQARVRLMLEKGMPILFVGVPTARFSILNEEQLAHRIDEVTWDPLKDPDDVEECAGYIQGLDLLMARDQIFSRESDLTDYFDPLFAAGRRRYGVTSNLVRDAAISASREKISHIQERHLSDAVVSYLERTPRKSAIASDDLSDINPFTGKRVDYKGG
jgi:hypothetical protein